MCIHEAENRQRTFEPNFVLQLLARIQLHRKLEEEVFVLFDRIYITFDNRMLDFFDHENRFMYHMEFLVINFFIQRLFYGCKRESNHIGTCTGVHWCSYIALILSSSSPSSICSSTFSSVHSRLRKSSAHF